MQAELFSVSQLEQHAKSLAAWHDVGVGTAAARGPDRLLPRLDDTIVPGPSGIDGRSPTGEDPVMSAREGSRWRYSASSGPSR